MLGGLFDTDALLFTIPALLAIAMSNRRRVGQVIYLPSQLLTHGPYVHMDRKK